MIDVKYKDGMDVMVMPFALILLGMVILVFYPVWIVLNIYTSMKKKTNKK